MGLFGYLPRKGLAVQSSSTFNSLGLTTSSKRASCIQQVHATHKEIGVADTSLCETKSRGCQQLSHRTRKIKLSQTVPSKHRQGSMLEMEGMHVMSNGTESSGRGPCKNNDVLPDTATFVSCQSALKLALMSFPPPQDGAVARATSQLAAGI